MIHEVIHQYYSKPQPYHKGSGRISVSSFGRCIRSVMLGLTGVPQGEFPPLVREVMSLGVLYEDQTFGILKAKWGDAIQQDIVMANEIWSGRMDFLLKKVASPPTIIEHKATGNSSFDYDGKLPEFSHVCQAWLYGQLYFEKYHVQPTVILYYRAWSGKYGEFLLRNPTTMPVGVAAGWVNDKVVERYVPLEKLPERRKMFESAYAALPEIPEVPCTKPCDAYGCTFRGERSCGFYDQCWGKKE